MELTDMSFTSLIHTKAHGTSPSSKDMPVYIRVLIMQTLLRGQAAPQAEIISLGEAKNQFPGQKLPKC